MSPTRLVRPLALVVSFCFGTVSGGTPQDEGGVDSPDNPGIALSAFGYWVEGEEFFVLPIATVDFGNLHLEGRYNYEDFRTGSLFAGWNFSLGSDVEVTLTPMAGLAVGQTIGFVPALEAEILYDILGFWFEGEYVIDLEDQASNFLYIWSELYASPTGWLTVGLAAQRMRVVETDVEVSRGLLIGTGWEPVWVTLYLFDLTETESFTVLGIEWSP